MIDAQALRYLSIAKVLTVGALCFLAGAAYLFLLINTDFFFQNVTTVFFISFLGLLFFFNFKFLIKHPYFLQIFLGQTAAIYLGIIFSSIIFHAPLDYFWVSDSRLAHLPSAIEWAKKIETGIDWSNWKDINTQLMQVRTGGGGITHLVTGFFITIWGVTPVASLITLLIFNLLTIATIYGICEILFDKTTGKIAIQLYALCPTILFYHLTFYKESAVQFFIASIILLTLIIFHKKKYFYIPLLVLSFYFLKVERYYMSYLMLSTIFLSALYLFPKKRLQKQLLTLGIFLTAAAIAYWRLEDVKQVWGQFIDLTSVERTRYSSYTDVSSEYNYNIPYIVALFKIYFTPYFTLNKFSLFREHAPSMLWIWGSFINQAILLFGIIGGLKKIRENRIHLTLWIPFFLFLMLAAYVSPWSGRLRDSFYSIVVCYSGWIISEILKNPKGWFSEIFKR